MRYTPLPPRRTEDHVVADINRYLYEGLSAGMTLSEGRHFSRIFHRRAAAPR